MGASPDARGEPTLSEPGIRIWTPSNDLAQSAEPSTVCHGRYPLGPSDDLNPCDTAVR